MSSTKIIKKMCLGSAQWGSKYGISNVKGKTEFFEISKILDYAYSVGISHIDTAALYGSSELNLGKYRNLDKFKVITKTIKITRPIIKKKDVENLFAEFEDSLKKLNLRSVYGLLIHNTNDFFAEDSRYLLDALNKLKLESKIKKIGISIYKPKNLDLICDLMKPDIVQLPLNVLDQRFVESGSLYFLKKKKIKIHARSIFLQGLLFYDVFKVPNYFRKWKVIFEKWKKECNQQGFSPMEAALSYVINIKEIDNFIIGFENSGQLLNCISYLKTKNKKKFLAENLKCNDTNLLNPANWKL